MTKLPQFSSWLFGVATVVNPSSDVSVRNTASPADPTTIRPVADRAIEWFALTGRASVSSNVPAGV